MDNIKTDINDQQLLSFSPLTWKNSIYGLGSTPSR